MRECNVQRSNCNCSRGSAITAELHCKTRPRENIPTFEGKRTPIQDDTHGVCKVSSSSTDVLFKQGLMTLMTPAIK